MESPGDYLFNLITFKSSDAKRLWRESIFERDRYRCTYCGSGDALTLDHVKPRCKGGPTNTNNCVTACRACNQAKGSMDVNQFITMELA
jgi:5-methylcytosine-specific restriction endonuclease McrA